MIQDIPASNLVILIDGPDALAGGEPTILAFLNRLYSTAAKALNFRVLVFTRVCRV